MNGLSPPLGSQDGAVRLMHLSDIHFGAANRTALEAAADFAQRLHPDAIIVAGDITQHGSRKEFAAARDWFDRLDVPVISTPGNHDTPAVHLAHHLPRRLIAPFSFYDRYLGDFDCCDDVVELAGGQVRICGLNTARGVQGRLNWAQGVIKLSDLDAALDRLAKGPSAATRILVCHHPLSEPGHSEISVDTRRAGEALRRCAAARVDVILTGHIHDAFAHPLHVAGRRLIQMGSGTLSTRLRATRPTFCVLTIEDGLRQELFTVQPEGLSVHCNYDSRTDQQEKLYHPA